AERRERRIDVQDTEAESTVYERARLRFLYSTDGVIDVLRSLGEPLLRHDANPCVSARAGEALEIALAHQRLLDEDADRGVSALRKELRPEDGFVGQRAHWKREGPLAQPVLGTGHADRGNTKALLDRLARRDGIVGDARAEDGEAALVDELAVGVDHRLDRSLRKSLDLTEHDLHWAIDDLLLQPSVEHELERLGQVVSPLLREVLREPKVEEVAELDRLRGALVGHLSSVRASTGVRLVGRPGTRRSSPRAPSSRSSRR